MSAIVRFAGSEFEALTALLFLRYPEKEWATFARFGWRDTATDLVLSLAAIDAPGDGDLDINVANVALCEPYSLRVALAAEHHPYAIGLFHSHPHGSQPVASAIDDDMDEYYAEYFSGFAGERPYVSLILSKIADDICVSGRVWWKRSWRQVTKFTADSRPLRGFGLAAGTALRQKARVARLTAAFGNEATDRLSRASVAVIGAGGTGSAAIEVLARAGVGHLIVVDSDIIEDSNLERVHGSLPHHVRDETTKVAIASEHIRSINPEIKVDAFVGLIPQDRVVDALTTADVVIGCTDKHFARVALSDLAIRYLVPVLDCGVLLEGGRGRVTGQIIQIVRMLPDDPCVWCRGMVSPQRLAQEVMSSDERQRRVQAADAAVAHGDDPNPYWRDEPQLNTVGYLTTTAGALTAGYAIGWITGRFSPPFSRLQMNLISKFLDVTDTADEARPDCLCRSIRGTSDQGRADSFISPASHWPEPTRLQ